MSSPQPSEIILPTGRPAYFNPYSGTYITNRSYALRLQRGYSQGLTRQEARGHGQHPGISERVYRAAQFQNRYGFALTVWERIMRNGGSRLNTMLPDELKVTPELVAYFLRNAPMTGHDADWIIASINERIAIIHEYQAGNIQQGTGLMYFTTYDVLSPMEWWYYHV